MSAIEPLHRQATLPDRPKGGPGYWRRVFGREHRVQLGKASKFEPVSLKMGKVDDWSQQVKANYSRPTASSADGYVVKQLKAAVEAVRADFTTDTVGTQAAFGDAYEPLRAKWAAARDLVKSHEDARGLQSRRRSSSSSIHGRRSSQTNRSAQQQSSGPMSDFNRQLVHDRQSCTKLMQAVKEAYPDGPTTSSADGYAVKQLAIAVKQPFSDVRNANLSLWNSASKLVKDHQAARRQTQNGPGAARWEDLQNPFENPFE